MELQGRIIAGSLDADTFWGPAGGGPAGEQKSSLRVIQGRLRLDSCRVSGAIRFPRCVFIQDLAIPCTEVLGDLDLTDSEMRGAVFADCHGCRKLM